jgi:hypothetical protein
LVVVEAVEVVKTSLESRIAGVLVGVVVVQWLGEYLMLLICLRH